MKIWLAEFRVDITEKFETEINFKFTKLFKEYLFDKDKNEYMKNFLDFSTYFPDKEPAYMKVEVCKNSLIVKQAFDKELSVNKQEKVRKRMGKFLIKFLKEEKKIIKEIKAYMKLE